MFFNDISPCQTLDFCLVVLPISGVYQLKHMLETHGFELGNVSSHQLQVSLGQLSSHSSTSPGAPWQPWQWVGLNGCKLGNGQKRYMGSLGTARISPYSSFSFSFWSFKKDKPRMSEPEDHCLERNGPFLGKRAGDDDMIYWIYIPKMTLLHPVEPATLPETRVNEQ